MGGWIAIDIDTELERERCIGKDGIEKCDKVRASERERERTKARVV